MRLFPHQKENNISFFPWGFHIQNKWLQIKNENRSLKPYFEDNYLSNVAIYGMGSIGRRLYEELCLQNIDVKYGIDQNAQNIQIKGLELKTLGDDLPKVDAIVVTPIAFYEIEKSLCKKMGDDIVIVSIEDVVDYCVEL